MRYSVNEVLGANVDDIAPDGLRAVNHQGLVLVYGVDSRVLLV